MLSSDMMNHSKPFALHMHIGVEFERKSIFIKQHEQWLENIKEEQNSIVCRKLVKEVVFRKGLDDYGQQGFTWMVKL